MSILISAPIRTGKTLYTVKCIFDELNKGRQVFTNIVGIKIDGVISVSSSIDSPFDWRTLPNGSVLVWDEAHEHPAFSEQDLLKDFKIDETPYIQKIEQINLCEHLSTSEKKQRVEQVQKEMRHALTKKKEEIKDIGRSLLLHGHFGIEIYFITQRVTKLNTDVLASVTTHFVMRRKFGMDAAIIWEFGEAMTTWSKSTSEIALNKRLWRYPKHLYKFYVSSENHQVRKSFPAKYWLFALIPIFLFYFGFMQSKQTGFFGLFEKEKKQVEQVNNTSTNTNQTETDLANKTIVCTPEKMHIPECQELQQITNDDLNKTEKDILYFPNDPYITTVPQIIELKPDNFPRLSGCIKYGGQYYGIDQQGNRMPNISQETCRRWIENSERPFDYFANDQSSNYSEPNADIENPKLKNLTDYQDQKNHQYIQNTIN